jgi:hypothetical protein
MKHGHPRIRGMQLQGPVPHDELTQNNFGVLLEETT